MKARRKLPLPPFAIPGHEWIRPDFWPGLPPERIVRRQGNAVLVRYDGKPVFPSPSETPAEIARWKPERVSEEIDRFFRGDRDATANLVQRAQDDQNVTRWLELKIDNLLERLFLLAEAGNATAATAIAKILRKYVGRLSALAESKPDLLQSTARRSWRWPVMKSRHPYLNDNHERLLKRLQLGEDTPLEIHESARWIMDAAGEIAFALLLHLDTAHAQKQRDVFDYGRIGRAMSELPPFSADCDDGWWTIAEVVFLAAYPQPEDIPELAALIKAPSKRRSPGRIKAAILRLLKERFLAFAKGL